MLSCIICTLLVDSNSSITHHGHVLTALAREFLLYILNAFLEADINIMVTNFSLGAWGKDWLRQLLRLLKSLWQLNTANSAILLIAFPTAAGNIAANNALHRQHLQLLAHHAVALKLLLLEELRHIFIIYGNHVVWHNVSSQIKPEFGHLGKNLSLLGDFVLENVVKSRNTICCNHDNAITCIIYLANLTGFEWLILFHNFLL